MRILTVSSSLVALLSLAPIAHADWNWCSGARELAAEMDLRGVTAIEVRAVAGDLEITGTRSPNQVRVTGEACVQRDARERIDEIRIVEERDGGTLRIIADVPEERGGNSLIGALDLTLTVPDDLPITVYDSSGGMEIEKTGPLTLTDSSGDITLEDINGDVHFNVDSSGDIRIHNAGNVYIRVDSSGSIDVRNALSLTIDKDSSGDIDARQIAADVTIGSDSSGDINVTDVGGGLTVRRDGSGRIDHRRVAGNIDIPERKRN